MLKCMQVFVVIRRVLVAIGQVTMTGQRGRHGEGRIGGGAWMMTVARVDQVAYVGEGHVGKLVMVTSGQEWSTGMLTTQIPVVVLIVA